jgi:hypothetical protein
MPSTASGFQATRIVAGACGCWPSGRWEQDIPLDLLVNGGLGMLDEVDHG